MAAWIFQKWIEDQSDTLTVKIYPSNTLGQEREVYEGMQLGGGASCTISGTAILNNFNSKVSVLDFPFLWENYQHVHDVLDGAVGDTLSNEFNQMGFHVLAWMDSWGYRSLITADKAVTTAEQVKGMKIRTIESPVFIEALNAMGANATPMAFGEVYPSLQTGVLDGFEHSPSVVKANKFYEIADHITLTRHLFGPLVFVYSKLEWEKLTESEQSVIQQAALLARDVQRSLAPIREKESLEYLKEKGMSIHEIDTTVFRENTKAIQDRMAEAAGATDVLKQIRESNPSNR